MSQLSDLTGTTEFLDKHPYVDTGLKATGIGAGAYATLALVREVLDALEDRKDEKRRLKPRIGKDTIVVTIPNTVKGASAREAILEYAKVHRKPVEDEDPRSKVRQARNADGTFASGYDVTLSKGAATDDGGYFPEVGDKIVDWSTGIAGLGLGWILTQKVHDFLKQKRLKREISAAQKEYIDLLAPEKVAQYVGLKPAPKEPGPLQKAVTPGGPTREASQDVLAAGGTLAVLLAMASSIITKKWMDDRFKDPGFASADKAKVKNIVFKTASGGKPLECDAVDVVSYAKVASIAMALPADKVAAIRSALSLEKMAALKPEGSRGPAWYMDPYNAVDTVLGDIGVQGDDSSKWALNESPDVGHMHALSWFPLIATDGDAVPTAGWQQGLAGMREKFQNAWMDQKYAPKRTWIAQQYINRYLNNFNGSSFGKSWLGQFLSPLFEWLGGIGANFMGNSEWGSRRMLKTLQDRARSKIPAGSTVGLTGDAPGDDDDAGSTEHGG